MPKKASPRAPAGARIVAGQVAALVKSVGPKAAAKQLGVSAGRASEIARASAAGKVGRAIGSTRGLKKWSDRVAVIEKNAPAHVRKIVKERAPEVHRRSTTKAGRARQSAAGDIRSRFTDKQIGKAAGITYQKATAIRTALANGKELKPADQALWDKATAELNKTGTGIIDGIRVITAKQAQRLLAGMTTEERQQHHSEKRFTDWKDVKEWVKHLRGDTGLEMVKAYNSGTDAKPSWSFILSYEDMDDLGLDGGEDYEAEE